LRRLYVVVWVVLTEGLINIGGVWRESLLPGMCFLVSLKLILSCCCHNMGIWSHGKAEQIGIFRHRVFVEDCH